MFYLFQNETFLDIDVLFKLNNRLCCTLDQTKLHIVRAKAGVGLPAPFAVAVQQSCADRNLTGLSKNMLCQFTGL